MALEVATIGENVEFLGQAYWSGLDGTLINTVIDLNATGTLVVTDADSIISHTIEYSAPTVGEPGVFPNGSPSDYFTSSVSGTNILVTYNANEDIVPMNQIKYLETIDNLITVSDWSGLVDPQESPEMKLMEENNIDHIPVTADVTVEYSKDSTSYTVNGSFTIYLVANYNTSADLLRDAIDEREGVRL